MSKHVLITGGAGFIGAHLANELLGRGYHVCAALATVGKPPSAAQREEVGLTPQRHRP